MSHSNPVSRKLGRERSISGQRVPAVFISYSRRDKEFVARLHDALAERKYDIWVDWQDIPPSAEWLAEIRAGVESADAFIYLISPDSLASTVCGQELEHAASQHKRIVPVVRRDPDGVAVPPAAASLNWIFLREGDDFDAGLGQLLAALEQDLDNVRTHTRLGLAAGRWEASGRDKSQLLRGAELAAAESWLVSGTDKEPEPTQLQREYVLRSRQGATRRQRSVISAVTLALVATAVLAVVALIQRSDAIHERNVAFARSLDASAQNKYNQDPELSVLLAVKAAQVNPSSVTEEALREALAQSHVRIRYTLAAPVAGDALWSPDGKRLLVTSPQVDGIPGWARIYTPGSDSAPVALASAPAGAGQSGWDAAGDRVVIGGGTPAVYDALTGRLIARVPGTALFAALTSDGTRVVTVDAHSVGHVFDVATRRELATFHPRFSSGATCFALSPDGSVAAQCDTKNILVRTSPAELDTWSVRTGALLHSTASPAVIGSVAFSPDSSRYVFTTPVAINATSRTTLTALVRSQGLDGTFVYDTLSGRRVIAFSGAATTATFSPFAAVPALAYATTDDLGHVYSFLSGRSEPLIGSTDVINSLRFDRNGTDVVAASNDGTARVYDAATGGLPIETLAGHKSAVTAASFGLDDEWIATASDDGTVRVWAGPTPLPAATQPPSELAGNADADAASIAFTMDSARILEASGTGAGQMLDAHTLKVLARFSAPAGQGFAGAGASSDGRVLAALSGPLQRSTGTLEYAGAADLYVAASGRLIATLKPVAGGMLLNAAFDHAGDKLVTVGAGGSSDVWDTQTGRLLYHLPGSTPAAAAAFSQDGSQLAIVHYPTLPAPGTVTFTTAFHPITIDLYDALTGRRERTITGDTLTPEESGTAVYSPLTVAFSPDGRLLAVSGADQAIELYDPATGRLIKGLGIEGAPGGSFVESLAFSPNGKLLAAGAASGAYVWRLPGYNPYPVFQHVPTGSAYSLVGDGLGVLVGFTADSQYLLTSGDLTVNVWDPADHLELFHAYPVARGALSPDGTQIVTASLGGVNLYPCDLCGGLSHLFQVAKRHTTRQLTAAERETYLSTQG